MLRGDEVGVLLADALLRKGIRGTYATTIVSSSMLRRWPRAHGVGYAETLTGFKWISRAAPDLVYGYEEALGYAVAPELVRDKDGISAALLVAELAAAAEGRRFVAAAAPGRARCRSTAAMPPTRFRCESTISSITRDDAAAAHRTAERVARQAGDGRGSAARTPTCCGWPSRAGASSSVRPGTEPKLKAYLEVVEPSVGERAAAARRLRDEALRGEVGQLVR